MMLSVPTTYFCNRSLSPALALNGVLVALGATSYDVHDDAVVALHCDHKHLAQASAAAIRAAGYALLVYTVNETAVARRLLGWPVDCIVTDALDRIGPES